jgi:sulfur relay (sulfurtransferase) complex TusBCD TusD component (DsrE family)
MPLLILDFNKARGVILKLGILINEGPYQHQASDTALQYVKAAIRKRPRNLSSIFL